MLLMIVIAGKEPFVGRGQRTLRIKSLAWNSSPQARAQIIGPPVPTLDGHDKEASHCCSLLASKT